MMHIGTEGCEIGFILVAEDAGGTKIICESFGDQEAAMQAYQLLTAPTVCVLKQTCTTEIIAHKEKGPD